MKYVALTAGIVLVVLAVAVVYWAAAGRREGGQASQPKAQAPSEGAQPQKTEQPGPALEAKGVEIERRDASGQIEWKLSAAGTMRAEKSSGRVVAENVSWTLQTPDQTWRAEAKQATMQESSNDVVLGGTVRLSTADGRMKIEADTARYEMATGKIVIEGPVRMEAGGGVMEARRAVVDIRAKVLRATDVHGRYPF